jgi:hypothetical protein
LQEDPVVGITDDPMSFNRYLYCDAGPVDNVDPSGMLRYVRGRPNFVELTRGIAEDLLMAGGGLVTLASAPTKLYLVDVSFTAQALAGGAPMTGLYLSLPVITAPTVLAAGAVVVGVAGVSYAAYEASDWATDNTSLGRGAVDWVAKHVYGADDIGQ